MGACCTRSGSTTEDSVRVREYFKDMKIREMDFNTAKQIFENFFGNAQLSEELRMKLSGKNRDAFEKCLNKISRDNLIKLAEEYFMNNEDTEENRITQIIFFKKIWDCSTNKFTILFHILGLLKNEKNEKEKGDRILELIGVIENTPQVKFPTFKNIVRMYIKQSLTLPTIAVKEHLLSLNSENKELMLSELEDQITNIFSDTNINNYVEAIFKDFELVKFCSKDDNYMETYVISMEDMTVLFPKGIDVFNFDGLRASFLSHFS